MVDFRTLNEADYHHHLWKRRLRVAVSAPPSDREILLFCLWKTDERPTVEIRRDRLLWPIFVLRTDWFYQVIVKQGHAVMSKAYHEDEKAALVIYRELCKEFPRSKEIDYGFPFA